MKNTWVTEKGSKIEMVTEEIKVETIEVDGIEIQKSVDEIKINSVSVNGKIYSRSLHIMKNQIQLDTVVVNGKRCPLIVVVPDDVIEAVWGEYNKRRAVRLDAEIKAENEYWAHHEAVLKMMNK